MAVSGTKVLRALGTTALIAWAIWSTVETRKLHHDLATQGAALTTQHEAISRRDASFQTLHDDLIAEVSSLKAQLMMLRLAQRPVTRADLNSIGSRLDILEANVRSRHSAGQ